MEGKRGTRLREPAPPAAERQQVFVVAVRAAHSGEPLVQIPAIKIFANDPRNDRPEKTVRFGVANFVALLELVKIIRQNLPEQCLFRFSWLVNSQARCKLHYPPHAGLYNRSEQLLSFHFIFNYFGFIYEISMTIGDRPRFFFDVFHCSEYVRYYAKKISNHRP